MLAIAVVACGDNHKLPADQRIDAPTIASDAAVDTQRVDVSIDAARDAAAPVCEVGAGCGCGTSGVCGTGTLTDPFRCCDTAEDTCIARVDPCTPLRCSVEPDCCVLGNCPAEIQGACGGATFTCSRYGGSLYQLPDGTPCDDGRACTSAVPLPTLVDCVGTDDTAGGPACTRDRPNGGALASDCPATAPICSGTGAMLGDSNGGGIVGGACCPQGTACDLNPASSTYHKCFGDFGRGTNSNDVCRAGVCSYDSASGC
jgi:hypothetical protein